MKIWCLRCGMVLAQTGYSETTNVECPCCGEKMAYSVKNGVGYIASLASDLKINNSIYFVSEAV